MAQVKCTECGQLFNDDTLNACPKCGCPASECVSIHNETNVDSSEKTSEAEVTVRKDVQTTDTGYEHEKVIQQYATLLFKCTIIWGVIMCFFALIALIGMIQSEEWVAAFLVIILAPLGILLIIFPAYIIRAFLTIYANMSINLHELNMKLQCKETLQSHDINIKKEEPVNTQKDDSETSWRIVMIVFLIIIIILFTMIILKSTPSY